MNPPWSFPNSGLPTARSSAPKSGNSSKTAMELHTDKQVRLRSRSHNLRGGGSQTDIRSDGCLSSGSGRVLHKPRDKHTGNPVIPYSTPNNHSPWVQRPHT